MLKYREVRPITRQDPTKVAVVLKEKTPGSYQEGGCPEAVQKGEGGSEMIWLDPLVGLSWCCCSL